MKLSTTFQTVTFAKVFEILEAYSGDAEKNKICYKKASNYLQKIKISSKKEVDFEILLKKINMEKKKGKTIFTFMAKIS